MKEFKLQLPNMPCRIALVAAEFNRFITTQLLEGAREGLVANGVKEQDIPVYWVPGAFELPLAADRVLQAGQADAVIAMGAVIRGETAHFDYVAGECARGIAEVSLKHGKPVIFGVLTTDSVEQAQARAARNKGNKGFDCAVAALNMLALASQLADQGQ
ncbi:MAG: 6,7-dimethyl-8-ribityllumazine synthase [Xanthomonadales bacterium]|nr:6,7-dimethyl-8-ribityllumazine synthase [Xanthomonadales bacterium]NNL95857.1 6,7-dimethyl-8-ribityllumazine synthase [Xanthomonadales bacterium]